MDDQPMTPLEETIATLIARIDYLSILRLLQHPKPEHLRMVIEQKRDTLQGVSDVKWPTDFQQNVVKLDLDIVQFFYEKGLLDREVLKEYGSQRVKEWAIQTWG